VLWYDFYLLQQLHPSDGGEPEGDNKPEASDDLLS